MPAPKKEKEVTVEKFLKDVPRAIKDGEAVDVGIITTCGFTLDRFNIRANIERVEKPGELEKMHLKQIQDVLKQYKGAKCSVRTEPEKWETVNGPQMYTRLQFQ
jgi:hypothetical protein